MIYLDHHATTPVDRRVLDVMLPFFTERFGNAASRQHRFGWDANDAVERARKQVAALIGASTKEIVFTSGATEANNLAIKGVAEGNRARRDHLVTISTEHKAVLDPCKRLEDRGWRVTVLPVNRDGLVDLHGVETAVTEQTALVSVMAANNEIGVLQPIREIAEIAHANGALVHTDAVQAVGRVPVNVDALDVDLLSMTAHKMYGPKGVGALYVRRKQGNPDQPPPRLRRSAEALRAKAEEGVASTAVVATASLRSPIVISQIDGGGHERGMRSGTLNVPGIVGFGAAAEIARSEMVSESKRLAMLRERLLERLCAVVDGVTVNGSLHARLPGNLNVSFPQIDGKALLVSLEGVAVSSGAACTAAEPSHVLLALGVPKDRALASLRFGLGRWTTEAEIDEAARLVGAAVTQLRTTVTA